MKEEGIKKKNERKKTLTFESTISYEYIRINYNKHTVVILIKLSDESSCVNRK